MFVLCLLPVVELGLTFCEVEFAIAEMACVSRNVRTTRSESLPAFRSNVPFLSARSRILCVLQIFHFRNRVVFLFEGVDDLLYGIFCHACWQCDQDTT